MEVKFFREESGALALFKHGAGLYSEKRAKEGDEIVVLKARVSRSIVAVAVTRYVLDYDYLPFLKRIAVEMQEAAKRRETNSAGQSGVVV